MAYPPEEVVEDDDADPAEVLDRYPEGFSRSVFLVPTKGIGLPCPARHEEPN